MGCDEVGRYYNNRLVCGAISVPNPCTSFRDFVGFCYYIIFYIHLKDQILKKYCFVKEGRKLIKKNSKESKMNTKPFFVDSHF